MKSSIALGRFIAKLLFVFATLVMAALTARAEPALFRFGGGTPIPPSQILPVAVFGKDDRVSLPAAHRALKSQIGLLYEPRSHSVCTAFCVGADIIATAAHCLFRVEGGKPLSLANVWFRLGMRNFKSQTRIAGASAGMAAQNVMAGAMQLSIRPPIDANHDWALVRLARPVCPGGGLKLSSRPADEIAALARDRRVFQVAFHRDFRNWDLALSPCEVNPRIEGVDKASLARDFSDANQLILHTCDSGGASSGSPLLMNGPSGLEVVGINVGTYIQSKILMQNDEVVRRFKPDEIANTGVSSAGIAPRLLLFAGARMLASRERMRELQVLLERAGHPSGSRDGVYGPAVRAAIEAYERAERLAVTGLPTEILFRRLGGASDAPQSVRRSVARRAFVRTLAKPF